MTQAQGEAILDVYEGCKNVTAAWNQRSLVARNSKRKTGAVKALQKDMDKAYQEALERLKLSFGDAVALGIPSGDVMKLLFEHLPTSVLRDATD